MMLLSAAPSGAIYLGTEQFITLVSVLGVLGGILIFLLRHQFNEITGGLKQNRQDMQDFKDGMEAQVQALDDRLGNQISGSNRELTEQIKRNNEKVNERIDRSEERTGKEIANIKKEIGDIKGDFATSFVLREDFFRSMNGVEENIRETVRKIDQVIMMLGENKTR